MLLHKMEKKSKEPRHKQLSKYKKEINNRKLILFGNSYICDEIKESI